MSEERIKQLLADIALEQRDLPVRNRMVPQRATVEREAECDTDRLYGPLDNAIAYLREVYEQHPQATLDEHWTGYEDMEMRFAWNELQSDEEYIRTLEGTLSYHSHRRHAREAEREAKRTNLERQRAQIDQQLKELGQ
jgi:hypothetical protein